MRHTCTRTGTRRAGLTAASAAAVLLVVAGCGSADKSASASGGSSSSSASPSASGSSASNDATDAASLTSSDLFDKTYAAALEAGTARVQMQSTGAQGLKAQGVVSYKGGKPSMQMTMTMPQLGGTSDLRLVGGMLYLQIPGLTPRGKFLAVDPADKSTPMGKAFGAMTGQMDPLKSLQNLKGAIRSVTPTGQETVDGTKTTHYAVVVDTQKLVASMSKQMQVPQSALSSMPKTIDYDIWVDSQELIRKITFDVASVDLTMTMDRWGQPVSISAPPASKVTRKPGA